MGVISFNGRSSTDFGCIIEKRPDHTRGYRRGELIEIPGRNGAVVLEDGSYATYKQTYDMAFEEDDPFPPYKRAAQVAEWLLGSRGFCRLEDSFEPGYYRLARYSGPLNIGQVADEVGRCTLVFECQPQRYLKSGETPITLGGNSSNVFTINNPTGFEARPLLKFVDTIGRPDPVPQTFGGRYYGTWIGDDGEIYGEQTEGETPSPTASYTTYPVAVTGYDYAIITADAYVFRDENDNPVSVGFGTFNAERLVVPSNATSIILGVNPNSSRDGIPSLWLQAPSQSTGRIAVTINGTNIALDFSTHDTITLDCDLHDAYYIDGSNANNAVSFTSNFDAYPTFPGLVSGNNTIAVGDATGVLIEIIPRWWTI